MVMQIMKQMLLCRCWWNFFRDSPNHGLYFFAHSHETCGLTLYIVIDIFHLREHLLTVASLFIIEIRYRNGPEITHRRMHSSHFTWLLLQRPQLCDQLDVPHKWTVMHVHVFNHSSQATCKALMHSYPNVIWHIVSQERTHFTAIY